MKKWLIFHYRRIAKFFNELDNKNHETQDHGLSNYFFVLGSSIVCLAFFIILSTSILFFLDFPITKLNLAIGAAINFVFIFILAKQFFNGWKLFLVFSSVIMIISALLIGSIYIEGNVYDISYDGQAYHQEAIMHLSNIEGNMDKFRVNLMKFIELANAKGIQVEGLAGGTRWAEESHKYIAPLFVNFVHSFNSSSNHKLTGMHFDIEVWNNEKFDADREKTLREYIELIDTLVKLNNELNVMNNTNTHLSFDVSYWLDNQNGNIPELEWNGVRNYPFFHIADILGRSPVRNKIVVMAYRNYVEGKGGSARLSKEELDYIRDQKLNLHAIIALETGDTPESQITYFGQTKNKVRLATQALTDIYTEFPQFYGIAVHSLPSYLELE